MKLMSVLLLLFFCLNISAQTKVGTPSAILKAPKVQSNDAQSLNNAVWNIAVKSEKSIEHHLPPGVQQHKNAADPLVYNFPSNKVTSSAKKRGSAPFQVKGFTANRLNSLTPTDNTIAVSPRGVVVSLDNWSYTVYDTNGNTLTNTLLWNDFFNNDPNLNLGKYDPRVVYDRQHDRFVIVILHGPASQPGNKILMAFSKTNNPVDGWNIYAIQSANNFHNTWFDFPSIALSNNELFVSGNMFKGPPSYLFEEGVIYQISLLDGYSGNASLDYKLWSNNISTDNGLPAITIVPVAHGHGLPQGPSMNFVMLWPDVDSNLYYFNIDKELYDNTAVLSTSTIPYPNFAYCKDGYIMDKVNHRLDSISTGSPWIQNAFVLDSIIHFTHNNAVDTHFCGIRYSRYNLRNNNISSAVFKKPKTYLSYPAVASFSNNLIDKSAAIVFLQADTIIHPQANAIKVDDNMVFSNDVTIRIADTMLNIVDTPFYYFAERWGDYSGIQYMYKNSGVPEVWVAAAYADSNARPTAFNTWVGQLYNTDVLLNTSTISKSTHSVVYPNPARNMFYLSFTNTDSREIDIELIDINGKKVKDFYNGYMLQGNYELSFNQLALGNGTYFVVIKSKNNLLDRKKIVVQN